MKMLKLNSCHLENETLVPRSSRCFFKGRLSKGVGQQLNHMFIYFYHKIRKLKHFIDLFVFFSPKGVGGQVNHMFIYFHHKTQKLILFINHFCFFSSKGVSLHMSTYVFIYVKTLY